MQCVNMRYEISKLCHQQLKISLLLRKIIGPELSTAGLDEKAEGQ